MLQITRLSRERKKKIDKKTNDSEHIIDEDINLVIYLNIYARKK